ncbi:cysteine desulfurase [Alicyclobacillus sacchari]|uniref:Cysteine desulfurase n=1 Tax=Alicyclobacillus sacchari TaxID=392010 RepID=A0A4R8LMW2_9BACL|nr:cysteine desulfurase family protein [Alicyclobacillus sacchari]TDY46680.1 cysteine desulfurase [Alicyclobacillus sacchari]
MEGALYLDYAATAPLSSVVRARLHEWIDVFGNPSSLHRIGMEAEALLSEARKTLRQALGADHGDIVFTGGGTEANNLAIFGSAALLQNRGRHLVTTAVEHPAVREAFGRLAEHGFEVTHVRPTNQGDIAVNDVLAAVRDDTSLVSVMHVNNETGAIFPVEALADKLSAWPKVRFHVDGTQALGKIPVSLADNTNIHLYTVSGHKVGGLKGVGALYVRQGVRLSPHVVGGGQEFGLRSGTENVLGAISFAEAAREAVQDMEAARQDAHAHRQSFIEGLERIGHWVVFSPASASPYIVYAALPGLKGEVIVHALEEKGVYVSAGSACSSGKRSRHTSHVLAAMGVDKRVADGAVRFSWHPRTSQAELEQALTLVAERTRWLLDMMGRR